MYCAFKCRHYKPVLEGFVNEVRLLAWANLVVLGGKKCALTFGNNPEICRHGILASVIEEMMEEGGNMQRLGRILGLLVALIFSVGAGVQPGFAAESIEFWVVSNGVEDSNMYRELARRFGEESGVQVKITPLSWGNFNQKYMTSMAAGMPPDAGIANLGAPMEWGSVGGLVDYKKEFPEATRELVERFYPGTLPQFYFRDHLYGLPTELVSVLMYYRRDIFNELGLQVPETWSELDQVIDDLEAAGYHFNFGWTRGEQWALNMHTIPYGYPGIHKGDQGRVVIDWLQPDYQKGVMHALNLWHLHDNLGNSSNEQLIGRLLSEDKSNTIALMVDGNWLGSAIQELNPEADAKWGVAPWPRADQGKANNVMGGTSYVIFEGSKHKHAAFRWIEFLNRVESQNFMIMHRLHREGQASVFNISPIREVWEEGNADFWEQAELAETKKTIDAVREIVDTFESYEIVKGKREADHLEAKILDRMGTFMTGVLTENAERHNLTRWGYIQKLAAGEFPAEEAAMQQTFRERLAAEYENQYPLALEKARYAAQSYEERFGSIIDQLDQYEHKRNILDILKWAISLSFLSLAGGILFIKRCRETINSYLFVSIPLLAAVIFVFIPMLTAFYLSLTEYHPVLPLASAQWVGGKHYLDSFNLTDPDNVVLSFGKTLLYVAITVPVGIAISLAFASLLNNDLKGQKFWRFLYFSPLITSAVSVSLIFAQIYKESSIGWLNAFLLKMGFIDNPILFLKDDNTFLYCVIGLAIWHGLAFNILLFLAGLQQIPNQLYRAADMDGANWFQKFWHVSLPGIRPQVVFVSLMGVIAGFQVFEQIYMLGGGSGFAGAKFGPNDAGKTMVPLIFDLGFEQFKMGESSAVAYILFAVILVMTLIQLKIVKKKDAF